MNQMELNGIKDEYLEAAIAAWEQCVKIIEDNVNNRAFQTWFSPIRAVSLNNSVLTIQVPSQFFYEWLEEHYVG